jgi:hypothetical protein
MQFWQNHAPISSKSRRRGEKNNTLLHSAQWPSCSHQSVNCNLPSRPRPGPVNAGVGSTTWHVQVVRGSTSYSLAQIRQSSRSLLDPMPQATALKSSILSNLAPDLRSVHVFRSRGSAAVPLVPLSNCEPWDFAARMIPLSQSRPRCNLITLLFSGRTHLAVPYCTSARRDFPATLFAELFFRNRHHWLLLARQRHSSVSHGPNLAPFLPRGLTVRPEKTRSTGSWASHEPSSPTCRPSAESTAHAILLYLWRKESSADWIDLWFHLRTADAEPGPPMTEMSFAQRA